jgi:hypothetical protein
VVFGVHDRGQQIVGIDLIADPGRIREFGVSILD